MKISYRSFKYIPLSLLAVNVLAWAMQAPQSAIAIDSAVDKSKIYIGDLITYSITVKRNPDVVVENPELAANLGSFEIRDYTVLDPESRDGQVIERTDYVISTFEVGEFEIPSLVFYYTLPGDTLQKELKTKKIEIVVESLKPSEVGDIRDVKPPRVLPEDYRQVILWSSIAFAFLAAVMVLWYVWKRKKAGKGLLPGIVEPPKPVHEIALEALTSLQNSTLLADGFIKQYYIEVSEIVRRYIEGRYFIVALEQTTYELTQNLTRAQIEPENIHLIKQFLEQCDLVKFAKHQPSDAEHQQIIADAKEIVEKTELVYLESPDDGESEHETENQRASETAQILEEASAPVERKNA